MRVRDCTDEELRDKRDRFNRAFMAAELGSEAEATASRLLLEVIREQHRRDAELTANLQATES